MTKTYIALLLLFNFVIPQLVSDMHYIVLHNFKQKKTVGEYSFSTYKYHHRCENQILKLHSFLSFEFFLASLIPFPKFGNVVLSYWKTVLFKGAFIHQNKRGPPLLAR